MRVIFMGTPDFAVPVLEALIQADHEVAAVVTQPDKPKGRGKTVQYTPVKEVALKNQIQVLQPLKVRTAEVVEMLAKFKADVIVVVAFGQILPKSILEMPKYGCINVHASLLPKYRGAAPIQWSIIDGEKETGITTMQMDVGLDTGDMILKEIIQIAPKETGGTLHDKLSIAGAKLLMQTLAQLEDGTASRIKQGDSTTSYAKMLDKSLGKIDWSRSSVQIERLIRGLNPWPSAYTVWNGKTMKIWDADVCDQDLEGKNGEVLKVDTEGIYIKTGRGILIIKELQLEGKKRMDADSFLRGNSLSIGTCL